MVIPPCSSFSTLRNPDLGGSLRPLNDPWNVSNPGTAIGNKCRIRTLEICKLLHSRNIPFVIEHPGCSLAWELPETLAFIRDFSLQFVLIDFGMFHSARDDFPCTRKPTKLLTNLPWLLGLKLQCDRSHSHDGVLRGARAKAASVYPYRFRCTIADALVAHRTASGAP